MPAVARRKPLYAELWFQVLVGIVLGILLGYFSPKNGAAMKPLGDAFIKAIRMMIAPVVFSVVVVGIAKMGDMKAVGRIGVKALLYFELAADMAAGMGLLMVNILQPGVGMHTDLAKLDPKAVAGYATNAGHLNTVDFLMNIIPTTVVDAFASGQMLQVLLFSILFGLALLYMGDKGKPLVNFIDELSHALFRVIGMIMITGSIGAFGAMAFTIGNFGIGSLVALGKLVLEVWVTCALFILLWLGLMARICGFSILKFLAYIKEEIFIVFGTSVSESMLPRMIAKLENLGCDKSVVGLVVPTGYSFNLDGTAIYMAMAAIFIAQAADIPLSMGQQLGILGITILTSKGSAAVTGGAFVTLAATLSAFPIVPVAGLGLLLGVDRFISTARALTNLIGNGVATIIVARWEGALDIKRMHRVLNGESVHEAADAEAVGI